MQIDIHKATKPVYKSMMSEKEISLRVSQMIYNKRCLATLIAALHNQNLFVIVWHLYIIMHFNEKQNIHQLQPSMIPCLH